MSGCWEGAFASSDGPGVIEEHYTTPSAKLMLGTTRYLAGGEATFFELSRIDFPKRILYRAVEDGLIARIDAGEGSERSREWRMRRASCP